MTVGGSTETRLQTAFHDDVIRGLSRARKSIPCRWLHDERGSEIFEKITLLDEYYPTRIETMILRKSAEEIAALTAHTVALVELGAGSGIKTEILLAATSPVLYVPIDICGGFLSETADRLRRLFPEIEMRPIVADFVEDFTLPSAMFHQGTNSNVPSRRQDRILPRIDHRQPHRTSSRRAFTAAALAHGAVRLRDYRC
jgi:uncharacterized SAM-dependent methyltransferase